jgi:hypothetical protein
MSNSIYPINRGINKAIEFKGLKAQYIWYLGGGLLSLLILFAALYIVGVNTYLCLVIIVGLTVLLFSKVYRLSHTYGQYGLMKKLASRQVPKTIRIHSRKTFTQIN